MMVRRRRVACLTRRALLAVAAGVLLPGCERRPLAPANQAGAVPPPVTARPASPQPASPLRPDDFPVLDAVLAHLAADPEAPTYPALRDNTGIVLHRATAGASGFLGDDQIDGEFRRERQKPPADAVADLQARNNGFPPTAFNRNNPATDRHPAPLDAFKPATSGVVIADCDRSPDTYRHEHDAALMKAHPRARCFVRAWLPGYSKDGRTALLRTEVGPAPHGATATYLLKKDDAGKWTVAWRKFALYA